MLRSAAALRAMKKCDNSSAVDLSLKCDLHLLEQIDRRKEKLFSREISEKFEAKKRSKEKTWIKDNNYSFLVQKPNSHLKHSFK